MGMLRLVDGGHRAIKYTRYVFLPQTECLVGINLLATEFMGSSPTSIMKERT